MKGFRKYKSLDCHKERYESKGYSVEANTIDPNRMLTDSQLRTYKSTEFMDEYEELELFYRHYHVLHARNKTLL